MFCLTISVELLECQYEAEKKVNFAVEFGEMQIFNAVPEHTQPMSLIDYTKLSGPIISQHLLTTLWNENCRSTVCVVSPNVSFVNEKKNSMHKLNDWRNCCAHFSLIRYIFKCDANDTNVLPCY